MLNIKSFLVLLVLAVASMYFAITNWKTPDDSSASNELLFPKLSASINEVDVIEVQRGTNELTIQRLAAESGNSDTASPSGGWVITNRENYPASAAIVGRFVRGLADLRVIEEKTSDPERYSQLSLGDPAVEASGATRYRLKRGDDSLVEIITGKTRSAASNADQQELYVRKTESPKSWLVQGDFVSADTAVAWLNQTIVELPLENIARVQVDHPGEEPVVIDRDDSGSLALKEIPDGYKVKLEFAVNDLANSFSSLDLVDVFADKETDYSEGITATVDTRDGVRVRMQTGVINDEEVARFVAMPGPVDDTLESSAGAGESDASKKDDDTTAADNAGQDNEIVDADSRIAELNDRWSGWVYKIRSFKLKNITRKKSEFIEQDAPPEPTSESPQSDTTNAGSPPPSTD